MKPRKTLVKILRQLEVSRASVIPRPGRWIGIEVGGTRHVGDARRQPMESVNQKVAKMRSPPGKGICRWCYTANRQHLLHVDKGKEPSLYSSSS